MFAVCCHVAADSQTSEASGEVKLTLGHDPDSKKEAVAEPLEGSVEVQADHLLNAAASECIKDSPTGEAVNERRHDTGPVDLTFTRPDGIAVHVSLESRPLCVRFSKTSPLTVTQVSRDLTASAAIQPGDVLTYVDGIAISHQAREAGLQLRHALRYLPERSGTTQSNNEHQVMEKCARPSTTSTTASISENFMTWPFNEDEIKEKCARPSTTSTTVSISENGMTGPLTTAGSPVSELPKCSQIDMALLLYQGHLANTNYKLYV